jgi:hypothetical protein
MKLSGKKKAAIFIKSLRRRARLSMSDTLLTVGEA